MKYNIMTEKDTLKLLFKVVNDLNTLDKEKVRVELYKRVHEKGFEAINVAYSIMWDIFLRSYIESASSNNPED